MSKIQPPTAGPSAIPKLDASTMAPSTVPMICWGQWTGTDLAKWPVLTDYVTRIAARPKVREALKAEGLLKVAQAA